MLLGEIALRILDPLPVLVKTLLGDPIPSRLGRLCTDEESHVHLIV